VPLFGELWPQPTRAIDGTARAKDFVERQLAAGLCVQCGATVADRELRFTHRPEFRGWRSNVPICRLVRRGAHPAAIERELARCEIRCVPCNLTIERPRNISWARRKRLDEIVGEGETAIRSGAKDVKRLAAKQRAFLWKVREIA
jgi:hypothetical protein